MNLLGDLRRLACALGGSGPWRIGSFDQISCDRTSYAKGVHQPEDFTGLLLSESGEPVIYGASTSLLDQSPDWATFPDGRNRYLPSGLIPASPRQVFSLADAGVMTSDGIVYCRRTRRAVRETLRQWTSPAATHPVLGAIGYPAATRLPGLTLSLLTLSGQGFYHFLIEAIPRLHLLRPWLQHADHVLCVGSPGSLQARWLAHAGVPARKIVWMEGLCHVACEQLLFTSYTMRDQQPTPWTVAAIRASFPATSVQPSPSSPRRLWISRRDANIRIFSREDELLASLPGFTRVELAKLSPADQIALVASAEVIAGPHGAGLANVVFGRAGARVIEITPSNACHQPLYARLASASGLKHAWVRTDYDHPADLPALASAISSFCPPCQ